MEINATNKDEPHQWPPFLHVVYHPELIDEQRATCKSLERDQSWPFFNRPRTRPRPRSLNVVARNGLDLRNRTSIEPVALTPTPKIEDD